MPCFCLSFNVFFYSEIPKNRLPDDVKMRTRHVFYKKDNRIYSTGFSSGARLPAIRRMPAYCFSVTIMHLIEPF